VTERRKVIVHIATSADGYIARPDGDIEWLTSRPAPKGFYGMDAFTKTVDATVMGRKTYEAGLAMGATFDANKPTIVFSRSKPPAKLPVGVEFVNEPIEPFVRRLRERPGKNIWLMGGGELIASFLDAHAIDEFVVSIVPIFIGDGIPLIARRYLDVELELESVTPFDDGLVQLHYRIQPIETITYTSYSATVES
jgi:dihydrofolate reductase